MTASNEYTQVSLSQGPCFGTCPVFTMTLQPNGSASYVGRQYAPYKGEHSGTISPDSMQRINAQVRQILAQADELPREIETGIVDLAMTTISIVDGMDTLHFAGTIEFAEPVATLRTSLLNAAENTAWQRSPEAGPVPANELLVTLQAPDQIQVVTERYYRQQMKLVRMVSENPATFLVTFDPYTMTADEMVKALERQDFVTKVVVVENK